MKNLYLIGLSALVLVACEDSRHFNAQPESTSLADFVPAMNQKVVVQPASAQAGNVRDVATDGYKGADPAGVYLAYRYGYGLVMPSTAVKSTADKHMHCLLYTSPSPRD